MSKQIIQTLKTTGGHIKGAYSQVADSSGINIFDEEQQQIDNSYNFQFLDPSNPDKCTSNEFFKEISQMINL
jgi:hypothetical protein